MKVVHATGGTGVLGLLGIKPDRFTDPYFSQILRGVQNQAADAGREVLLLSSHASIPWAKIDALLLTGALRNLLAEKPAHIPCVSILHHYDNLPSVVVDDFEGVRQATERLIDLGHERIAYLSLANHPIMQFRIAGYQRALRDAGIATVPTWIRGVHEQHLQQEMDERQKEPRVYLRAWGYQFMQNWLRTDWREIGCTALLAQNDHVALGALAAFEEAGIRVPSEVSLIGFDDLEICEYTTPTLSSIAIPLYEVGAASVRSLLRELGRIESNNHFSPSDSQENVPETVLLPAHFQARDSIAPAP